MYNIGSTVETGRKYFGDFKVGMLNFFLLFEIRFEKFEYYLKFGLSGQCKAVSLNRLHADQRSDDAAGSLCRPHCLSSNVPDDWTVPGSQSKTD